MKCLVAVWLLVGVSLCVPQFGKGEASGPGPLGEGWAGSPLGNAALGAGGGPSGVPRVASAAGGAEEASSPGCPEKVLAKSEQSARSRAGRRVPGEIQERGGRWGAVEDNVRRNQLLRGSLGHWVSAQTLPRQCGRC